MKLPIWNVMMERHGKVETVNVIEYMAYRDIFKELKKTRKKYRDEIKVSDDGRLTLYQKYKIYQKYEAKMSEELRRDLLYYFWSKCEYEILISGWPPRCDVDAAAKKLDSLKQPLSKADIIQVLDAGYDPYTRKVDVYEQIMMNYEHFKKVVYEYIKFLPPA